MSELRRAHALTWRFDLCEGGYTSVTLEDRLGYRWGWVINAGDDPGMWVAHTGSWSRDRLPYVPMEETLDTFDTMVEAQEYILLSVAKAWRKYHRPDI